MSVMAVTGAGGFVGHPLVEALAARPETEVHVLVRPNSATRLSQRCRTDFSVRPGDGPSTLPNGLAGPSCGSDGRANIRVFEGDLMRPQSLCPFVESADVVIHLAYLRHASAVENLSAARHLAEACRQARIRRLVHCSTAAVAGQAPCRTVDESTPCRPVNEYEQTKLQIEKLLLNAAADGVGEVVILRPTAVFGPGGENLRKLARELVQGSPLLNYLRSCLHGHRRMNAVSVANVVSALAFLATAPGNLNGEVFLVSDDDSLSNTYRGIEMFLRERWVPRGRPLPRFPVPRFVLSAGLKLLGRSNIDPARVYDSRKLLTAGWNKPVKFEDGLAEFADWYERTQLHQPQERAA